MSVNGLIVASEAARRCGDEAYTRITRPDWLDFLNSVQRDISTRIPCVEYESYASTQANDERLMLPADLVQIRFVRYSDQPGTVEYADLGELPFDEWRERTNGMYPLDNITDYCARLGFIDLVGRPTTTIADAVQLGYFGLAADLTDLTTQSITLPDMLHDYLVDGMVILGKRKDKRFDEAAALEGVWRSRESEWMSRASDRARDRRTSLRPKSLRRPTSGMV